MEPLRITLSRQKGFRLQELSHGLNGLQAVKVTRPGIFGNPFTVQGARAAGYFDKDPGPLINLFLRDTFAQWLGFYPAGSTPWMGDEADSRKAEILDNLPKLRGKNLACFCKAGEPCHADILLAMANPVCEEVR